MKKIDVQSFLTMAANIPPEENEHPYAFIHRVMAKFDTPDFEIISGAYYCTKHEVKNCLECFDQGVDT